MVDNNQCSICLEDIEDDHVIKTLSCGHKLHFRCYTKVVYRHNNFFINCPLCREVNKDVKKPYNDDRKNIAILCSQKIGKLRCSCKTKNGNICKHKSRLLNYGMCYQHNKDILREEYYPLMIRYMYLILSQKSKWENKLYYFDIGKKLLIKKLKPDSDIEELLGFFYEYFANKDKKNHLLEMYDYFNIEKPPEYWIKFCSERYILI